jgi:hypothetical protein
LLNESVVETLKHFGIRFQWFKKDDIIYL